MKKSLEINFGYFTFGSILQTRYKNTMKTNIKLLVLVALFLAIASTTFAQNKNVRDHTKLQNELSFENVMKRNTGFTVESAKIGLAQAKEKAKAAKKRQRTAKKRDDIYARIEELKTSGN